MSLSEEEKVKLRFDYAWKWFESAARQRMVLFNYYLIITGILTNALVISYKEGYVAITVGIGFMGILTSLGFLSFDVRNRGMAKTGEDILEKLENDVIFPGEFVDEDGKKMGPLTVEREKGMREGQKRTWKANLLKHKYWIWSIQGAFALLFLMAIFMAIVKPSCSGAYTDVENLVEKAEKLMSGRTLVFAETPSQVSKNIEGVRESVHSLESEIRELNLRIQNLRPVEDASETEADEPERERSR